MFLSRDGWTNATQFELKTVCTSAAAAAEEYQCLLIYKGLSQSWLRLTDQWWENTIRQLEGEEKNH